MDPHALPPALHALLTPAAYPHPVDSIELVQTHISWVLLTGRFAYKIKRPVRYDFVDLRSALHRAFLCREELRLNRRFAPELYLDVCDITSDAGEAKIAGSGEVIEHAVRMVQFARADELDRLLAAGRVETSALEAFGRSLAGIHARLPAVPADAPWGRAAQVREILLENLAQCARASAPYGDPGRLDALQRTMCDRLERAMPRFELRRAAGRVRECHGDLHADNVVMQGGRLLAFDCLEFSEAFRWIDVADEIAFLRADLGVLGYPAHAHAFLGGYLAESGDYGACGVLDVYGAHRALVRAKVTALALPALSSPVERDAELGRLEAYVGAARAALEPARPVLVLMQGYSGSGKTWLARRLAPVLRAIHLRSDVERKRLAGLPELGRSDSPAGRGLYAPEASARTYEHLAGCAEQVLEGGLTAIVDATFGRREERARFRELAGRLGVRLHLVSCRAAPDVLRRRVGARLARAEDASEADLGIVQWQEAHAEPLADDEGLDVIEVDTTGDDPLPGVGALARRLAADA